MSNADKRCKCTMAQSLTGDGCRYCQPQEYIDRLEEWLDEERAESEWISMKDQYPPIIGAALGWNATANMINRANTYRIFNPIAENTCDISHWMPLPEPPK